MIASVLSLGFFGCFSTCHCLSSTMIPPHPYFQKFCDRERRWEKCGHYSEDRWNLLREEPHDGLKLAQVFSPAAVEKAELLFATVATISSPFPLSAEKTTRRDLRVLHAEELFCRQDWRFFEVLSPFFQNCSDQAALFLAGLAAVPEWRYNVFVDDKAYLLGRLGLLEFVASARQAFGGIFGGDEVVAEREVRRAYADKVMDLLDVRPTAVVLKPVELPVMSSTSSILAGGDSLASSSPAVGDSLASLEHRLHAGRFCLHYTRTEQLPTLLTTPLAALSTVLLHPKLEAKHLHLNPNMGTSGGGLLSEIGILIDGAHETEGAVGYPDDLQTINGVSPQAAQEVFNYGLSKRSGWLLSRFEHTKGKVYPVVLEPIAKERRFFYPTWYQRVGEWDQLSETVATMKTEYPKHTDYDDWFAESYTEVWFPTVSKVAAVVVPAQLSVLRDIWELQNLRKDVDISQEILDRYPGLVIATLSSRARNSSFIAVTPFKPPPLEDVVTETVNLLNLAFVPAASWTLKTLLTVLKRPEWNFAFLTDIPDAVVLELLETAPEEILHHKDWVIPYFFKDVLPETVWTQGAWTVDFAVLLLQDERWQAGLLRDRLPKGEWQRHFVERFRRKFTPGEQHQLPPPVYKLLEEARDCKDPPEITNAVSRRAPPPPPPRRPLLNNNKGRRGGGGHLETRFPSRPDPFVLGQLHYSMTDELDTDDEDLPNF